MSNEPDVFNYETHTEREFEELLVWLASVGWAVQPKLEDPNAPYTRTGGTDKTGFDCAIVDRHGLIVAETYHHVGEGEWRAADILADRILAALNAGQTKTAAPTGPKDGQGDDTTHERE